MKSKFFLIFALILMAMPFSCSKKNSGKVTEQQDDFLTSEVPLQYEDYAFIDPEDYFTLDYRAELPEKEFERKKVKLSAPEGTGEGTTSFIPGLRPLDKYQTKYSTKKMSLKEFLEQVKNSKSESAKESEKIASERKNLSEEELKKEVEKNLKSHQGKAKSLEELAKESEVGQFIITKWGPGSEIPPSYKNTQFYVEFNFSPAALQSLKDGADIQREAEKILTITPHVQGKYVWYGTKMLAFETDGPLTPLTTYKMKVSEISSLGGKKLTGQREFTLVQQTPSLTRVDIGKKDRKTYYYYDRSEGVPSKIAKFSRLWYDGYLTEADANRYLSLQFTDKNNLTRNVAFKLTPEFDESQGAKITDDKTKTNCFYLEITGPIEDLGELTFADQNSHSFKFNTLLPFVYSSSYELPSYKRNKGGITIYFNHEVDPKSVEKAFSISEEYVASSDISVSGSAVSIKNIDLLPGEKKTVSINEKTLKNVYGYFLDSGSQREVTVTGHYVNGYAKFIDEGVKMMEAQFPHKLIFEYMNAEEGSSYNVSKTNDPLTIPDWDERWSRYEGGKRLNTSERNRPFFEEIDLDEFLNKDKKGWVKFEADVGTYYNSYGEDDFNNIKSYLTVQVTNLAATARIGINKAVVMVRSLDKNEPVRGADVYLQSFNPSKNGLRSKIAKTDENGIAIIEGDSGYRKLFTEYNDTRKIAICVAYEEDKIIFFPQGHSTWSYSVYTSDVSDALKEKPRTFMFTDRGLYKPGETVTFRGIDRNQRLGSFVPFNGNYTISLEKNSWQESRTYGTLYGTTLDSGSFWGSFKLPEDLEPGSYVINYRRNNGSQNEKLYFTVQFFEARKTQGEIVNTQGELYAGDTITSTIKASYLAGGYLAGDKYTCSWFSQPTYFYPSDSKLSSYVFTPGDPYDYDYEGSKFLNSSEGTLSGKGEATVSCSTEGDFGGKGHIWLLRATVTDESNESLTISSSKTIHPALYYTGIGKGFSGFPKTGKEVSFPIVLVTPDEQIVTDKSLIQSALEFSFTRHYWTYDYQNSVNESIYKRYTEHSDVEYQGAVKFDGKPSIKFTPKKAGYYTLLVKSRDKNGKESRSERSFYVTGSDASFYFDDDDSSLKLTTDKKLYTPGETARILLESPLPEGEYLITTEREGIFSSEVRHIKENTCVLDIPVARNYVPVFYVTVSSYSKRKGQPTHEWGEKDLDKPKGYFGVTPVFVDPMVRAFSISADFDKPVYRPGETATITLTATKGGKPVEGAEITLMGVDRAVLDIINYHVPNPIDEFYQSYHFPLCTTGGDSRYFLMDPVTYSIKNLQGGDSGDEKDEDERKDFRPTAFFEPCAITGEDGKVTLCFKLPDNLTTYRLTAFGVKGELLALQEDEFAVQNPINVQSVQPSVLRERDTAECGVILTNISDEAQEVTVSAEIRSPRRNSNEDETLGITSKVGSAFIDGETTHTVTVGSGDTSAVYFDLAAEEKGDIEIVYKIKSNVLNEKLVSRIKIKKTYTMETVSLAGTTGYTEKKEVNSVEGVIIPSFAEDNQGSLTLSLDATRLGLLGSSVNYLFEYPYGCMEQQTSKILPLVIFKDYIKVFSMESEVSDVKKCVKSFFRDWKKIQHANGGFPYWPSDTSSESLYVSLRVAHIYALALQNGWKESDLQIDIAKLKEYIMNETKANKDLSTSTKAYACYVGSLNKWDDFSYLEIPVEAECQRDLTASAYLALAYMNKTGSYYRTVTETLLARIRSYMRPMLRSVDIQNPIGTKDDMLYSWQYSKTLQKAVILKLLVLQDPNDSMVERLIFSLLSDMKNGYWTSTSTTSAVLDAMSTVIKQMNLDATNLDGKVFLNEKEVLSSSFRGAASKPVSKTISFSSEELRSQNKDTALPLRFSAKGKGRLYYTATLTYALPDEILEKRDEGFDLSLSINDAETGKTIQTEQNDVVYPLESGKLYRVKVTVKNVKSRTNTAIRIPVPSGAEILNPELSDDKFAEFSIKSNQNTRLSNYLILENEADAFFDSMNDGSVTIEFTMRAKRRGVYPVPPVQAECMYESEIFGRTAGYIYTIK